MDKICENCGNPITKIYRRPQKYCSKKCFYEAYVKAHAHVCEVCGKTFQQNGGVNRFCSYTCAKEAEKDSIKVTCIHCCKEFGVNKYRYEHYNTQFCSRSCKSAYAWLTIPCHTCGNDVRLRRSQFNLRQSRNVHGFIFCDLECTGIWQRGENHTNWQGGHRKWRGPNWQKQAALARERDKHICQRCGITEQAIGRPLDVHHIIPWRKFNNDWVKANDLSNLISYCPACHTTVEARHHRQPRNHTIPQSQSE